jgi:hypothetical protein
MRERLGSTTVGRPRCSAVSWPADRDHDLAKVGALAAHEQPAEALMLTWPEQHLCGAGAACLGLTKRL